MTGGYTRQQQSETVRTRERPVLPTGALRRTGRARRAADAACRAQRGGRQPAVPGRY